MRGKGGFEIRYPVGPGNSEKMLRNNIRHTLTKFFVFQPVKWIHFQQLFNTKIHNSNNRLTHNIHPLWRSCSNFICHNIWKDCCPIYWNAMNVIEDLSDRFFTKIGWQQNFTTGLKIFVIY